MSEESTDLIELPLHVWMQNQPNQLSHYPSYCSRRLSRLRQQHPALKNKTGSKRHAYGRSEVWNALPPNQDVAAGMCQHLWLQAERCWAQGKLQEGTGRRKKYQRAVHWADALHELVQQQSSLVVAESSQLEVKAYLQWQKANNALEKWDYESACRDYATCMQLYYDLSQLVQDGWTEARRLEWQDIFVTRADTVVRPLFRYALYEWNQQSGQTLEEPRLSTQPTTVNSNISSSSDIVFRGQTLHSHEWKDLQVVVLKFQSLERTDETSFLSSLSLLDEALEVVDKALKSLDVSGGGGGGPAVTAKRQTLSQWKAYLQSTKTFQVMEHTQQLLENDIPWSHHAERVHVYDALLQHARTLLALEHDGEEEDEFALQVQANVYRLRALKAYHMGLYYFRPLKKHSIAWTLLEHAGHLSERAQEEIAACDEDMPHANKYLKELEDLQEKRLKSAKAALQAACYGTGGTTSAAATDRPLLLRLEEEDAGTVLSGEEPLGIPVPCKPVFYDLAYGYAMDAAENIEALQSYLEDYGAFDQPELMEEESKTSAGGLFGWFSSPSK